MFGQTSNSRLGMTFLLVAIPAVTAIGAVNFYALRDLNFANRDLQEISRSLEAVRALEGDVGRALAPLVESLDGMTGADIRFAHAMREIEVRLQSCGNSACHGAVGQPREMAQRLTPYMSAIRARAADVFLAGATAAQRVHAISDVNRVGQDVRLQLRRMSDALLARAQQLQERSEQVYVSAWRMIAGAIVIIVPLAVCLAYLISRQLVLAQQFEAQRGKLQKLVSAKTRELEQAHASLMRSEKLASIGVLAAGIAHELNNPLTSVLMNVNLLMEDAEDRPDIRRELKRVSDDALRCRRIINDLRDFSRRPELKIRPSNLNEVVRDVLNLTEHQLALEGIALTQTLAEIPPVLCDAGRMRQVLMNVFVNAIQAMSGRGTLRVATAVRNGYAVITISDSGCGIPDAIRSRIFDPFFTTKVEGTGLGLSIAYGIMEEHGGAIEIESPVDGDAGAGAARGTTVRLSLPTQPVRATATQATTNDDAVAERS